MAGKQLVTLILQTIDDNEYSVGEFPDLAKAFDTKNHGFCEHKELFNNGVEIKERREIKLWKNKSVNSESLTRKRDGTARISDGTTPFLPSTF